MTKVSELVPGDQVKAFRLTGLFIGIVDPHPLHEHLVLVIWKMGDGTWSFDALDKEQDVGHAVKNNPQYRKSLLRDALQGGTL